MFRITLIVLLLSSFCSEAKHQTLGLQMALDKKLVLAKATSLGTFQGFCMKVELKNISRDSLIILIEPGRRLNSLDDKDQDILIVKRELVPLKSSETKSVIVKGYCCQSSNLIPQAGSVYGINKLADSNLVRLARYLNTRTFEEDAEQQAVWAISDNRSTAAIASVTNALVQPLRSFVSIIKDEPEPWYTIVTGSYMYPNRMISVFPLFLKGTLNYSSNTDSYITVSVFNEKGAPVCFVKSEWLKAASNSQYELSIPVRGMAKGKYTVQLKSQDQQLVKKEFEL